MTHNNEQQSVIKYCNENMNGLLEMTSNLQLLKLKSRFPNYHPNDIIKALSDFRKGLKSKVLPLDQQVKVESKKMQEKLVTQIAKMPFTEDDARALIGKRVVLTVKDLSGQAYEVRGTMVDVKPHAQHPWVLHIRRLYKRKEVTIYTPEPSVILGLREGLR